jgi:hypothetical protein
MKAQKQLKSKNTHRHTIIFEKTTKMLLVINSVKQTHTNMFSISFRAR